MIVSLRKRFIFVHIMKAAGTSVTNDICRHLDWRDLVLGGSPLGEAVHLHYKKHLGIEKHSSASEIRKFVGEEIWKECFKFAFVRHPYSRAVSLYNYIKLHAERRNKGAFESMLRKVIRREPDYGAVDWLSQLRETEAYYKSDGFSDFIRLAHEAGALGMRPQVAMLADESGAIAVDFVGKVENMDRDLRQLMERIGLPPSPASRVNRTDNSKGKEQVLLSEADRRFLGEVFSNDFDAFGYDREVAVPVGR